MVYIVWSSIVYRQSTLPAPPQCLPKSGAYHHTGNQHNSVPPPTQCAITRRSTHLCRRLPTKLLIYTPVLKHWKSERRPIPNILRNPAIMPPSSITPRINLPLRLPRPVIPAQYWLLGRSGTIRNTRRICYRLRFKQQPIPRPLRLGGPRMSSAFATVVFGVWRGVCLEAEFANDDGVLD
jgi:hypothetical protein